MFTAKQIKELLDAKPFKPFRIYMSDGNSYDIPNHDAAWVTAGAVEVGTEIDKDGFALHVKRCAILHITSIEGLQPA